MANAVVTVNVLDVDESRRMRRKVVTVFTDGGDYVSGGITIDLATTGNPNNFPAAGFTRNPTLANLCNYAVDDMPFGYLGTIVPGTDLTNWKLKIDDVNQATPAELSGAMPTGFQTSGNALLSFRCPKNL